MIKLLLSRDLITKIIEKVLAKLIKKKFGADATIRINELTLNDAGPDTTEFKINIQGSVKTNDLVKIIEDVI